MNRSTTTLTTRRTVIGIIAISVMLAACGGTGGAGGVDATTATPPSGSTTVAAVSTTATTPAPTTVAPTTVAPTTTAATSSTAAAGAAAPMPCFPHEVDSRDQTQLPQGPSVVWCGGWGYIESVDLASGEIVFDLAQVKQKVPGDESQGWEIVNENPRLRVLPVDTSAEIRACNPESGASVPGISRGSSMRDTTSGTCSSIRPPERSRGSNSGGPRDPDRVILPATGGTRRGSRRASCARDPGRRFPPPGSRRGRG